VPGIKNKAAQARRGFRLRPVCRAGNWNTIADRPSKENGDTDVANFKTESWQKPRLIFEPPNVKNNLQPRAIAIVQRLIWFCAKLQICRNAQNQKSRRRTRNGLRAADLQHLEATKQKAAPARNCSVFDSRVQMARVEIRQNFTLD
jgi:hypothetical protein